MKQTTVHVPESVEALIEGMQKASGETGEVPVLTQADITRLLLRDAGHRLVDGDLIIDEETQEITGIEPETLSDLIPKHKRAKFLYRERKDRNWLPDMKGGFEGRVRDRLTKRFKNGYDPEEAREVAEEYIGEARDFWLTIEDDRETFEEKKRFVLDRIEDYRQKYETTTYDPNEEFLSNFGGVEDGEEIRELDRVRGSVVEQFVDMYYHTDINNQITGRKSGRDTKTVVGVVADNHGIEPDHVREILEGSERIGSTPELDDGRDEAVEIDNSTEDVIDVEAISDGGVDRGDGPVTDGGYAPGQEGYWTELASESDSKRTVRDRIVEECDPDDQIHGITVTAKRQNTFYIVVSRSTTQHGGDVIDLRTFVVDLDAGTVKQTDNGIWIPADIEATEGVLRSLSRSITDINTGEVVDPTVDSISGVDPSDLLSTELNPDDYDPSEDRADGWGESWGNGNGAPPEAFEFADRLDAAGVRTDRFSRLNFGQKTPWERYAERTVDDCFGNYGVETLSGDGLVIIDVDYPEEAPLGDLPETYRVSSPNGSDERAHHYYVVDDPEAVEDELGNVVKPGWGDVWISGEYTVGPGCYHEETGKRYDVVDDRPITELSSEEFVELIEGSMRSPPGAADDEDELDDEPVDPDPEPEPVEDDLDDDDLDDDQDSGRAETVVCHDCGSEIPRDDAGMDLVDGSTVWICSGGCDSDELITDGGIPRDQEIDYPRSLDELPPEYDPRYWEAVEDADRVRCNGIESAVLDEDREEIGHVLMLDYDSVGRQTVMREAEDIDGLSVVVESSTGSHHVYGLSVRPWEDVVETARESSASESYVDEMDRRGEFTLRVSGKGDEPAPTVVGISGRGSEDSDTRAVSDPHLSVLQDMASDEFALTLRAVRAGLSDSHEPVGSTAVRSTYETEVDR